MKTIYLRNRKDTSKNQQVITIVSELDQESKLLRFGFSVCSKHDTFNKKLGRYIAERRLTNSYSNINKDMIMMCEFYNELVGINFNKFNGILSYTGDINYRDITEKLTDAVMIQLEMDRNKLSSKPVIKYPFYQKVLDCLKGLMFHVTI